MVEHHHQGFHIWTFWESYTCSLALTPAEQVTLMPCWRELKTLGLGKGRELPPRMWTVAIEGTLQSVLLSPKSSHWALAICQAGEHCRHPISDFSGEKEESFQETLDKTHAAIQSQVLLHVME